MSKLDEKFLKDYSLATLRDVLFASLANGDAIIYNSSNQKWENKPQPRFGTDFAEKTKLVPNGEQFTGGQFQTYDTLNFTVTGPDTLNKYRVNTDFIWSHNSASNDARFQMVIDGSIVLDNQGLRIEPKDRMSDQRTPSNILGYLTDLSIGNHTIELQCRPARVTRVTTIYKSVLEVWRVV